MEDKMKLGLLTSILDGLDFPEVIDIASDIGYKCLEVACWPKGNSSRRYAGVTHIDVNTLNPKKIDEINLHTSRKDIQISALAYYPNMLNENLAERQMHIDHIKKLIENVHHFGAETITSFIGRVQNLPVDENLPIVKEIWLPILDHAEKYNVKIAIENCPMYFGKDQWPGGQNLMTSPDNWNMILDMLDSDKLGINYDPSHFIWQQIDYIQPLYEFKDKIFHVHFKDIKLYLDRLHKVGVLAYPLEYMAPKLPGLGDINWGQFISALNDIGFTGNACVEVEDRAYENSRESILDSIRLSYRYLKQFIE